MAILIPVDDEPREVHPAEGRRAFTLPEMRELLGGGYLELVARLPDGRVAWCDEEGKLKGLPVNRIASALLAPQLRGDYIVGPLLITTDVEAGEDDATDRDDEEEIDA